MLASKISTRAYSAAAGSNGGNFDVLKFISRIETLYDAQQQKQPLSSSIEFKAASPKPKQQQQGDSQNRKRPQRSRSNHKNANGQQGQQGQQGQRRAQAESRPTPGVNTKNVRLQGLGSDIDSALETTPAQQTAALKKTFGRPQRFSKSQANGFSRPTGSGFRPRNSFGGSFGGRKSGAPFNRSAKGPSKSGNNSNRRSRTSTEQPAAFVNSSLTPEEGFSIINRFIHDPSVKTDYALVHSLDPAALTAELDSNTLTREAALWSALKHLPCSATQEEIKAALDTTFKGLSPGSLSTKSAQIGSVSYVNAVNSNFGIPADVKHALLQVAIGKAPVSSVIQK